MQLNEHYRVQENNAVLSTIDINLLNVRSKQLRSIVIK